MPVILHSSQSIWIEFVMLSRFVGLINHILILSHQLSIQGRVLCLEDLVYWKKKKRQRKKAELECLFAFAFVMFIHKCYFKLGMTMDTTELNFYLYHFELFRSHARLQCMRKKKAPKQTTKSLCPHFFHKFLSLDYIRSAAMACWNNEAHTNILQC